MRQRIGAMVLAALLGGCSAKSEPSSPATTSERADTSRRTAPSPDLAACAKVPVEEELEKRTVPIAVPRPFRSIVKSDLENLAVSTLDGGTVCVDTSWMAEIVDPKLSADNRFLSFAWHGYEAFGHFLVDRAGAGTVIDTGLEPVFSPSGKRVAGLQVSEAGWGGLEGFAIWTVAPARLTKLFTLPTDREGVHPEIFRQEFALWRIDNWVGEECLAISAASYEALDAVGDDVESAERTPFHARQADGWAIKAGPPPGACRES